jgi:ubiquinone/menaquinone biosynthesis C-methylase UbiE
LNESTPLDKEKYYVEYYSDVQRSGLQGWGNSLIDKLVESYSSYPNDAIVLEIGASSGEHIKFLKTPESISSYVALDLTPKQTDPLLAERLEQNFPIKFVKGNAEEIDFEENFFDLSISMCVLAHVDSIRSVLLELKRVTKPGGRIVIGMPCDPGLLNRLIKNLVTYRVMKRAGISNPRLTYALEHRNGISNILAICKDVFSEDSLSVKYFPFRIRSWNLNLIAVVSVTLDKK